MGLPLDDSVPSSWHKWLMKTSNNVKRPRSAPARRPADGREDIDAIPRGVAFRCNDYDRAHAVAGHRHRRAQLLFASRGVMRVTTDHGIWVVPPQRAVWLPAGTLHAVSSPGPLSLRNLYFDPSLCTALPTQCRVVAVSPLLRELILRAVELDPLYDEQGAEGRLMRVILDQIETLPVVPLHLAMPGDGRLQAIARALQARPGDDRPLAAWGTRVGASERTLARLFVRETGHTFGQWRQQVRLLVALEGLAQGRPVALVAAELGYERPSAFIAMFRRALGRTPARFFD